MILFKNGFNTFSFLFYLGTGGFGALIYTNCNVALSENDYVSDYYDIQPIENGNVSRLFCKFTSNEEIELTINNDNEQNRTQKTLTNPEVSIVNINYGNFSLTELKELIKDSYTCSQSIFLHAEGSQDRYLNFKFLDGSSFSLNNNEDGICKCIIDAPCVKDHNVSALCPDFGVSWHEQRYKISGKFSVSPNRLPLVQTRMSDLDGPEEWARHIIYPLTCRFNLPLKFLSGRYCNLNTSILLDGDTDSCLSFNTETILLQLDYAKRIQLNIRPTDNLDVYAYTKSKTIMNFCELKANLIFECKNIEKVTFLQIFTKNRNLGLTFCEIQKFDE